MEYKIIFMTRVITGPYAGRQNPITFTGFPSRAAANQYLDRSHLHVGKTETDVNTGSKWVVESVRIEECRPSKPHPAVVGTVELTGDQVYIVIDALRNSIQDTLDHAEPTDYEPGELEESVGARVKLLRHLGGSTAGIGGKNSYLLEEPASA